MKIKKMVVIGWMLLVFILVCSSIYAGFANRSDLLEGLISITVIFGAFGYMLLLFGDFFEDQ